MDPLEVICVPKDPVITDPRHYYYLLNDIFRVSLHYRSTIATVQALVYHLL